MSTIVSLARFELRLCCRKIFYFMYGSDSLVMRTHMICRERERKTRWKCPCDGYPIVYGIHERKFSLKRVRPSVCDFVMHLYLLHVHCTCRNFWAYNQIAYNLISTHKNEEPTQMPKILGLLIRIESKVSTHTAQCLKHIWHGEMSFHFNIFHTLFQYWNTKKRCGAL